jgi:hypothetical protein
LEVVPGPTGETDNRRMHKQQQKKNGVTKSGQHWKLYQVQVVKPTIAGCTNNNKKKTVSQKAANIGSCTRSKWWNRQSQDAQTTTKQKLCHKKRPTLEVVPGPTGETDNRRMHKQQQKKNCVTKSGQHWKLYQVQVVKPTIAGCTNNNKKKLCHKKRPTLEVVPGPSGETDNRRMHKQQQKKKLCHKKRPTLEVVPGPSGETDNRRMVVFFFFKNILLQVDPVMQEAWCTKRTQGAKKTNKTRTPNTNNNNNKKWIQHHTVPGWSPTPVLSGLKPR